MDEKIKDFIKKNYAKIRTHYFENARMLGHMWLYDKYDYFYKHKCHTFVGTRDDLYNANEIEYYEICIDKKTGIMAVETFSDRVYDFI